LGSIAISQLAKKESPSICKMRLFRALIGNADPTTSTAPVHAELFTALTLPAHLGQRRSTLQQFLFLFVIFCKKFPAFKTPDSRMWLDIIRKRA
jgi:hypothetical protein